MKKLNTFQDYLDAQTALKLSTEKLQVIQNRQTKRRQAIRNELSRLDTALQPFLVENHLDHEKFHRLRDLVLGPWIDTDDKASKTRYLFTAENREWYNRRAWLRPVGSGYTTEFPQHVWHWTLQHPAGGEIRIAEHGLRDPQSILEVTRKADDFLRGQGWILT